MTREFKKGEIVQLDADMANSGTVEVVRQTPLRKFTTVTDGRAQWDVMTYRLSPLPTEKAKELTATNDPELIKQGVPELTPAESTIGKTEYKGLELKEDFCDNCKTTTNFLNGYCEECGTPDMEHSFIPASNEVKAVEVEPLEACSGDEDNRYCWLNINDGKFSNSWGEDSMKYLDDELLAIAKKDGFKLIKYQCVNDDKFEFYNRMQLAPQQSKSLNEADLIKFVEWFTSEKSTFSIMYGNQEQRFADNDREYTVKEVYDIFLSQLKQ